MKNGRICGVEYLTANEDDDALIAEAHEAFKEKGAAQGAQGFEIWDGARFVYRFEATGAFETREKPGPRTWLDRLFDLSKLKRETPPRQWATIGQRSSDFDGMLPFSYRPA